MTLWDYLPQQHRVSPYWFALMHASISKSDTRTVQRTPFSRFTHQPRLSGSFPSFKCKKKVMLIAMSLFCVIDALYNHSLWCASDHLHTFEAVPFFYIV